MPTTPAGDSPALRRMVVRNLARRIVQQRTGAGTNPKPPRPLRRLRPLTPKQ